MGDSNKGQWLRARHNVHQNVKDGKTGAVTSNVYAAGDHFQLENDDDGDLADELIRTGAATKSNASDAEKWKKAKKSGRPESESERIQDEIVAGKAADGQGRQHPASLAAGGTQQTK